MDAKKPKHFHEACQQLSEQQFLFAVMSLQALPRTDVKFSHMCEQIAAAMHKHNSTWEKTATPARVEAAIMSAASNPDCAWIFDVCKADLREMLSKEGAMHVACPRASKCCACNGRLGDRIEVKQQTWFYSSSKGCRRGRLYERVCEQCGSVHQVDGYTVPAEKDASMGRPPKYPYPQQLCHPEWFQSTEYSVYEVKMLERYKLDFVHKHSSFQAAANVETQVNESSSSFCNDDRPGVQRQQEREGMSQKRFEEAFLRYAVVTVGQQVCPLVTARTNLNRALDDIIDEVSSSLVGYLFIT